MDIEREGEGDGAEEATLQHPLKITKLASARPATHPTPTPNKVSLGLRVSLSNVFSPFRSKGRREKTG